MKVIAQEKHCFEFNSIPTVSCGEKGKKDVMFTSFEGIARTFRDHVVHNLVCPDAFLSLEGAYKISSKSYGQFLKRMNVFKSVLFREKQIHGSKSPSK